MLMNSLILLLSVIYFKIFSENYLLKILILMEMFGLVWFCLLTMHSNLFGMLEGLSLILFSLLVLEGVVGIFGLILLLKFSNSDYFNLMNL